MSKAILRGAGNGAFLRLGGRELRAAVGRCGITAEKREGDHATPTGLLPLRRVLYRADRTAPPLWTAGRAEPIRPHDGWCDDPAHPDYNRAVTLPHPASCEALWRADHAYDLCVVLGWNDAPPASGRGSAIFLHLPPESGATEGCIALAEADLRWVLAHGLTEIAVEG